MADNKPPRKPDYVTYFVLNPAFVAKKKTTYAAFGPATRVTYKFSDRPLAVRNAQDAAYFRTVSSRGWLRLAETDAKGTPLASVASMQQPGTVRVPRSFAKYGPRKAAARKSDVVLEVSDEAHEAQEAHQNQAPEGAPASRQVVRRRAVKAPQPTSPA